MYVLHCVFSNFKSRSGELCITVQVEMQKPNIFVVQFALFRLILGVSYLHVARHTDGRGWCGEFGVKSRLTAVVRLGTLWEQTGLGPGKIRKLDKYKTINNYLLTRRWPPCSSCLDIFILLYCYKNSGLKGEMISKSTLNNCNAIWTELSW